MVRSFSMRSLPSAGLGQFELLEFRRRLLPVAFAAPIRTAFRFPQRIRALADPIVFTAGHDDSGQ
jgi:hypothetical protein